MRRIIRRLFGPRPKVVAICIPKSGTNLLGTTLASFPQLRRCPRFRHVQREPDDGTLRRELSKVKRGQYVLTHLLPLRRIKNVLEDLGFKKIFIYRDPRDIAVSQMFYVTYMSLDLPGHKYFKGLANDAERLKKIIIGTERGRKNIGEWLSLYEPWFGEEDIYKTSFEKLIGPKGGGTAELQRQEIRNIARHLGLDLSPDELEAVIQGAYSRKSATFRKGITGDWQNHFTEEHKDLFKQVAGQILIDWGYEKDFDW